MRSKDTTYSAAAVGEVNVTTKMKEVGAVIGGEGNGGVIYPESHYGRDALVGIALFLSSLAHKGCKVSELRASFPEYSIAKNRIDLTTSTDVDAILVKVKEMFASDPTATVNDIDGVKIDFPDNCNQTLVFSVPVPVGDNCAQFTVRHRGLVYCQITTDVVRKNKPFIGMFQL
jgi:phosphomannomutase